MSPRWTLLDIITAVASPSEEIRIPLKKIRKTALDMVSQIPSFKVSLKSPASAIRMDSGRTHASQNNLRTKTISNIGFRLSAGGDKIRHIQRNYRSNSYSHFLDKVCFIFQLV